MNPTKKLVLTTLLALALLTTGFGQAPKLIFVQQVFRHGHRYPIHSSPLDNSTYINAIHSSGELTKQGKSMHYILGQSLYNEYWTNLFGGTAYLTTYNQSKFYVKSTNVNRTIQSVQSQLLGIFENLDTLTLNDRDRDYSLPQWPGVTRKAGDVYVNAPRFNPVPVHVEKGFPSPWDNGDFLRMYSVELCPNQNVWIAQNKQSAEAAAIINDPSFKEAIAKVNAALKTNLTFWDIYRYYDNAVCMIYEGRQVNPVWTTAGPTKDALDAIQNLDLQLKMFLTQHQLKVTATGYFNETYNHFKRVTADQSGVQWAFYSAHDNTIGNYLARLNLTNVKCIYENYKKGLTKNSQSDTCILEYPIYTSNLIFEVYKYRNNTNTFKIRYNGEYRKIPFCNWALECNVEKYYEWFDSWKYPQYVKACGIVNAEEDKASTIFTVAVLEGGVILCFLIGFLYQHLQKQHEKDDEKLLGDIEKEVEEEAEEQAKKSANNRELVDSLVTDE